MVLEGKRNLGNTDRLIRAVLGFLLLAPVFYMVITGWWAVLAVFFAFFQFAEAALAY